MTELILVSDFDGTLYRGDEPVRHYARLLAGHLDPAGAESYLGAFERYLAVGPAAAADSADLVEAAALRESVDAWGAAAGLGRRVHGIGSEAMNQAFTDTRVHMVEVPVELEPVTELIEGLRQLRGRVRLLLATNSPLSGMSVLLDRLGATDLFDEVIGSVGKPDGLRRRLAIELGAGERKGAADGTAAHSEAATRTAVSGTDTDATAPRPGRPYADPWRLLSIGDHWRNEIEPAFEIGAATGYIDRFGRADGPASVTVRTAEELLPAVFAWADSPKQFSDPARPAQKATINGQF